MKRITINGITFRLKEIESVTINRRGKTITLDKPRKSPKFGFRPAGKGMK